MNKQLSRIRLTLTRNVWLLAAFFIPLTIRSIPEILSWPYPLGVDTLTYIRTIEAGHALSSAIIFVKSQLFYPLGTLVYWLIGDGIVVIKLFGPLLMGALAAMMYLYGRRGLGWSGQKSFMVSLLVAIFFVSLRNSWDLYAQSVGLIFLFVTLILLKFSNSPRRYALVLVFMLLTVLSHQLISVILFFIVGIEALRFLSKKSYKELSFCFACLIIAGTLFLFRTYSESAGSVVIPSSFGSSEPSFSMASTLAGLLTYGYGILIPFLAVGLVRLKDWPLRFWMFWCFGAILLLIALPSLPLYYWNRWYYLLVYPFLFFVVEGLSILYSFWSCNQRRFKRLLPKIVAVTYVVLLLALSGFYLAVTPEHQIAFFSSSNPYLAYIPSSMLQNTVSLENNPSLVNCFEWINNSTSENSTIVMHYALYDLAFIYIHRRPIVNVLNPLSIYVHLQNQTSLIDGMINASVVASNAGNNTVYTVWWSTGKGWYQIPSLPSNFTMIYQSSDMAVYIFK